MPLADELRPQTLNEIVGQQHILKPGSILRNIIESGANTNLIFYGPPGTGKTTVANIAAQSSGKKFYKLNAVSAGLSDIKKIIETNDDPVVIYLDEIQYFNKKQQQSLLETMESGMIQLIASTTENPYFYVYGAILSRSSVFEFKPVVPDDVVPAIDRAVAYLKKDAEIPPDVRREIALQSGGDVRKALNLLELLVNASQSSSQPISIQDLTQISSNNTMRYDKYGDETYDLASGLMKAMRGSDPDAALHYLARFLVTGDIITPSRRILACASEDVGLAYPEVAVIAKACVDTANQLGLPEAQLPLAQAVLVIATAPKSNSVHESIHKAIEDVKAGRVGVVPRNLQNVHVDSTGQKRAQNYLYPHDYVNHWVNQQYMPDDLLGTVYYVPGENQNEQALRNYWNQVKHGKL